MTAVIVGVAIIIVAAGFEKRRLLTAREHSYSDRAPAARFERASQQRGVERSSRDETDEWGGASV